MSSILPDRINYQAMISRLSQALHPDNSPVEQKQAFDRFYRKLEGTEIVRGDEVISKEAFFKEWASWVHKGDLNLWDGRDYPADVRSDMIETMVDMYKEKLDNIDLAASRASAPSDVLSADIDGSILKPYDHGFKHSKIMTREDLRRILTRDDLTAQQKWDILTRDDCWGLLTRDDIKNILTRDDFRRILTRDDIKKILTRDDFLTEDMKRILTRDDHSPEELMDILTRDDLISQIMTREDMLGIMTREDMLSTIMTRSDVMGPAGLAQMNSMSGGMMDMKLQRKAPEADELELGKGTGIPRIGELPGDRLELETPQDSQNIPRVGVVPEIAPQPPPPKARISNKVIVGGVVVGISLGVIFGPQSWVRQVPPHVTELRFPGIAAGCVANGECEDYFGENVDNCPADCAVESYSPPEPEVVHDEPDKPTSTPLRKNTSTPIAPQQEEELAPKPIVEPEAESEALIEYEADKNEIAAYECFRLTWYAEDVQSVTFGGVTDDEPPLEGEFHICAQCETKTYPLTVTYHDGSQEKFYQTISVVSGSCGGGDSPDDPPPSSPDDPPSDSPDDPQPAPVCGSGTCGDYDCGNSEINGACENHDTCPQDCPGGGSSCYRDLTKDACEDAGGIYVPSSMDGPFCSCPP